MKKYTYMLLNYFLGLLFTGTSYALIPTLPAQCHESKLNEKQKMEIKLFVQQAQSYIKLHGLKKASRDFTNIDNRRFNDKMYIFMIDNNQYSLANGGKPQLVGKDLKRLDETQESALKIYKSAKQNGGWVNYMWINPQTHIRQCKTSWVTPYIKDKKDNLFYTVGAGLQY